MKTYIKYIGILLVGLLLGWFAFGGTSISIDKHNHQEETAESKLWTCSMHPQIMQPDAGDCPICGMELIPASASDDGLKPGQFKMTKNALALANVETVKVTLNTSLEETLVLTGKLLENANETATQPAHFEGRIDRLFIKSVGEKVSKGQAIAEIYSPELVMAQQELITSYKLRKSQPNLYAAVRAKFNNWKIKDAQLEEIEKTGKIKSAFTIYSHVSGVVSEISINVGAHIMEGHAIFKVSNLKTMWAEFDVFEKQIPLIKKGNEIEISTNSDSSTKITARISFIDPVLNTETRTVAARAVISNATDYFKPGMFVKGNLNLKRDLGNDLLSIPKSAVLWTGKRSLVYIKLGKDPIFEMREVVLGESVGENYRIVSGLKTGEEIVVNGTFTVDAAAQLLGKKSMMSNNGVPEKKITIHRLQVNQAFKDQLQHVVVAYTHLKDELVLSNSEKSKKILLKMNGLLGKVDVRLLDNPEAHKLWMQLIKELKISIKKFNGSMNIDVQRKAFMQLSVGVINSVKAFGINKKIYNQYCPMANNDKGANWLSFQEEIKNPYFGDAMLTCGNIEETIN